MFYRVVDKCDLFSTVTYTKEEAITVAINHCVTEGLQILSFSDIEDCPLIIYIDPDDNSTQEINIYPITI